MKTQIIINRLISRSFNILRVNMVLSMPLLMFLLLIVLILAPIGNVNIFIIIALLALKSVFLSGWLNMFHACIKNTENENLSDEQKTINSLNLYQEFFPGVGKYFQKIFWGMLYGIMIFILSINLIEAITMHFLGHFSSFSAEAFLNTVHNATKNSDIINFWNKISHADKIKIYKLVGCDIFFIGLFSYLTMFWTQFVIVEDKPPIKAFLSSIKAVSKDPLNSFLMFVFSIVGLALIFVLNFKIGANIFSQLLILMLFVYFIVYCTLMLFLYFEKYR